MTNDGKADLTNLTIDPKRLWDSLMETARFGATEKGGIRRLAQGTAHQPRRAIADVGGDHLFG